MDAGLAALIGTGIGSTATLAAAWVNGRIQARTQRAQWSRERRRDAYAAYLTALYDRDTAMDAVREALEPGAPDLREVEEKLQRFVALARDVHRAAEIVILEGPESIEEAADRVAHASRDLSEAVRRLVEDARAGDAARKAADLETAAGRERILYRAVADFRTAAREVLTP
ncbi:proline dehydrogenase [Actinomadura algeriensis]|uniref:Outer membrane murein-binding lipoprotein Lpp n=1 Tax=Actinomadura algeriensis TaxID=1679523 RepID=A0ABR9K456_9ACTN|nr:proline dehydrogenase [Actinomadura algeriensis]MBE1537621.1 outer membrane murein-binding lipoprotein Lpp [Actinomadura algeriensis]